MESAFNEELITYWLSFVRSKDPNKYKLERSSVWPAFSTGKRAVLQQDTKRDTLSSGIYVEEETAGEQQRCAFVAALVEHMQD